MLKNPPFPKRSMNHVYETYIKDGHYKHTSLPRLYEILKHLCNLMEDKGDRPGQLTKATRLKDKVFKLIKDGHERYPLPEKKNIDFKFACANGLTFSERLAKAKGIDGGDSDNNDNDGGSDGGLQWAGQTTASRR